jgi:fatty acid synthase subunit beta
MVQSTHRPFSLNHGSIEYTLLVPSQQFSSYSQLRDEFVKSLPEPTDGFGLDEEPSSSPELFGIFLKFIADQCTADSQYDIILNQVINEFNSRYLNDTDIHSFAISLLKNESEPTTTYKIKNHLIKNYFNALKISNTTLNYVNSQLLFSAKNGDAKLAAIFGGQGNTDDYFEELREIYNLYGDLLTNDILIPITEKLSNLLLNESSFSKIYTQGLNIIGWLKFPESTPDQDYLLSAPVSCPIICIIQLCHYAITCKILGVTPGEFNKHFVGTTGHSQGLITAVAIAGSTSWSSFLDNAMKAVGLLFFIGSRCLIVYPRTTLPPSMLQDSLDNAEGRPSPMLSVRDLSIDQVNKFMDETNKHLPQEKHIAISLINGARNLVLSGPPESLYGFNLNLRSKKAPAGLDQSRVPYSQRKLKFANRFLPIHTPFHSHLLASATDLILQDTERESIEFNQKDLLIPVFDSENGENYQNYQGSVTHRLIQSITELPVYWETATKFEATHILEFGPGGVSGLGVLTHKNKQGAGSRIIIAGALDTSLEDDYGFKQEIFDSKSIKYSPNWLAEFKPKLVKTSTGKVYVHTKFSQLLGRAPLMVPGMTPTTVNSDIVVATTNAGYHIELAGGGYFSPQGMQKNCR